VLIGNLELGEAMKKPFASLLDILNIVFYYILEAE